MGRKDKDDDPGRDMCRKPGESGDELVERLRRKVAEGRQTCGTCGGRGRSSR
jgi:hypothetical protein